MQQGQVSFDALLMGIALAVLFGSLLSLTGFIETTSKETMIVREQKKILFEVAAVLSNVHMLSDGDRGTLIEYQIPVVSVPGIAEEKIRLEPDSEPVPLECSLSLDSGTNTITLRLTAGSWQSEISRPVIFDAGSFVYPSSVSCGRTLTIQKA